jgi:hypothetical protein
MRPQPAGLGGGLRLDVLGVVVESSGIGLIVEPRNQRDVAWFDKTGATFLSFVCLSVSKHVLSPACLGKTVLLH